jgi:hypothetical protein
VTDRSVIKDRQAACIHQFPITAPHSEQQPGACERCNLPWTGLTDRQREVFSGGRHGRAPRDDDALARVRFRHDAAKAAEEYPTQHTWDIGWLLAHADQLTAERDALRDARNRVLLLIAEADVIGLVSGHGFSVNDVRNALRLEADHA